MTRMELLQVFKGNRPLFTTRSLAEAVQAHGRRCAQVDGAVKLWGKLFSKPGKPLPVEGPFNVTEEAGLVAVLRKNVVIGHDRPFHNDDIHIVGNRARLRLQAAQKSIRLECVRPSLWIGIEELEKIALPVALHLQLLPLADRLLHGKDVEFGSDQLQQCAFTRRNVSFKCYAHRSTAGASFPGSCMTSWQDTTLPSARGHRPPWRKGPVPCEVGQITVFAGHRISLRCVEYRLECLAAGSHRHPTQSFSLACARESLEEWSSRFESSSTKSTEYGHRSDSRSSKHSEQHCGLGRFASFCMPVRAIPHDDDVATQCAVDPQSAATHRMGVCAQHRRHELRLFCKRCSVPICIAGSATDHYGHEIELITSTAARCSAMACDEVDQALGLKVRLIHMIQHVEGLESVAIDTVMGEQKRIHSHFSHLAGLLKDREASLLHDLAAEEARVKDRLKQERLRLEAAAIAVDNVVVRAGRTSSCASSLEVLQTSLGLVRDIGVCREIAGHANLQGRPSFPAIRFESQQSAEVALETMLSRHGGIATDEMCQSSPNRLLAALCRLAWLCVRYLVMAVRTHCMPNDGE